LLSRNVASGELVTGLVKGGFPDEVPLLIADEGFPQ
jgi:hypothetical protein